jgi:hypothetical protein
MSTLRGDPVDRPAFNFYELNGCEETSAQDPFNIYADPSWAPLISLAREETDRVVMRDLPITHPGETPGGWTPIPEIEGDVQRHRDENGSLNTLLTIQAGGRRLTQRTRRDLDVNTVWVTEHLLKDIDDFNAWLELPEAPPRTTVHSGVIHDLEASLGESGIVMLDTPDPLCCVAQLFDLAEYTVIAMTEPELFRRGLERLARRLYPEVEAVAKALPGRLWRIYGPEYASPPYLPPALFREYVTEFVRPMVDMIHRTGGFARIHAHGRLRDILDDICATGCDALDPLEPPPQGDVELAYVRGKYGRQLVLFGNLEITDIENLPTAQMIEKVKRALDEGMRGAGRGFVLMPSACPYGRTVPALTLKNYEAIAELMRTEFH